MILVCHLPQGRCGLKSIAEKVYPLWERSPSARKVWIEIICQVTLRESDMVTFRKEGVDWNLVPAIPTMCWDSVTFRKEGVDWNFKLNSRKLEALSHLPQGRCGLKLAGIATGCGRRPSPSARKVWIEMRKYPDTRPDCPRHLPQGRCGLKFRKSGYEATQLCHLPQGRCGLK